MDQKSIMRGDGEDNTVAWRYFSKDVLPFAALVAVECTNVGSTTLYKAAAIRGLNFYVFVCYCYIVATLLLLPLYLIFGRSRRFPAAKSPLFFRFLLLGVLGFIAQLSGSIGISYSSPTLASAMSNLTPAFTFTLAVIFRMERVVLRSAASQAKIIGAILSISGALVVVLYKGPKVLGAATLTIPLQRNLTSSEPSWIIGGVLLASQNLFAALWYIVQTQVMEVYSEKITVVFFYNLFAVLIAAPVCFFAESNLTSWVLKPDISFAAIIYSGVFVSLVGALIHTWGLHLKGPVYISLFRPFSIAIAVAMGAIFLGDPLHLGSVIGSVILCFGFYTVIWGKAREVATKTGSDHLPLLVTHVVEDEASDHSHSHAP